jgi:AcrR family transcriptional regulator
VVLAKKRTYDNTGRAAAAAQTRARILDAAYVLFLAHPFRDVTIPRIAEDAGVSVPTVVQHFRTKDALVEALIAVWQPREQALRDVPSGDPLEAARKICARYEETGAAVLRFLAIEGQLPAVDRVLGSGRVVHRAWVERTFGARLGAGKARERRVMALVAAYDIYTWHVVRRLLSADETVLVMAELAGGVLGKGDRR